MPLALPQLDVSADVIRRITREGARVVEVIGPWGSAKTVAAVQTAEALGRALLIVAPGRMESEGIYEDLLAFSEPDRCALFPSWEVLPTDAMAPADDIVAERMDTLGRLAKAAERGERLHVVVPVRSLLQYVAHPDRLAGRRITLGLGEEHDLERLLAALAQMGYERELMVEQRGQVSVRGGIFDIFPISAELPYRIEFFGDEIESIRRFEPETQRSVECVESLDIMPRSEKDLLAESGARSLLTEYLPGDALVVLDEPLAVGEEAAKFEAEHPDSPALMGWADARQHLSRFVQLSMAQLAYAGVEGAARIGAPMNSMAGWQGSRRGASVEAFWQQLEQWDRAGYTVVLLSGTSGERQRLIELLEERGYRPSLLNGDSPRLTAGGFDLCVAMGRMRAGFSSPEDRLAVLSQREMFGRHYVRRTRRRFEAGTGVTTFSDLRAGDFVVHIEHGIGRYLGLRRFAGKAGDFLAIQYGGGDKLYLPVTHIDVIQKYVGGGEDAKPKIDRLGGATWARTKARVRKAVHDMTEELLKLYAARESEQGHAFCPDTPWQAEFEDAFPYEETPDQARAIVEVKRDMESAKPMDRLVCGDVGYGKTEVALRAAFKAVTDGRQAAVLVPTTVLAEQHCLTFTQRLADYPIAIEMLSRFRSPKERKATIERLKSGEVDIVVGTHRLISKDIGFKNLGLLVIDEEQRFGVAQKERLKQLRTHVDVLTMTATPIPRTLNLSLMGIRDMSLINTAPNDRLPIHTCIENFDEGLIKEAIKRELARQGQVFFVHNRVQTILPYVELVRKLVPAARVAVGHGQMPEHELEEVMTAFIRGEIDVLVCTTIIGSGLDIPNANTIIINNADRFGLAELYQLRGRVGRYKHRAFAYLLVSGDRVLTEGAQRRLKALEEFSVLGAGFRLAMRDLEIRGCGNILGGEQHGHIAAVGYDTYVQLVAEAVAELKGEPVQRRVLPPFEIAVDAYIPEDYVPSEAQKITLYKRISGVRSREELAELEAEIADRFGPIPAPVQRLLGVMRVRAMAADGAIKRIAGAKSAIVVEFESGHSLGRKSRHILAEHFGAALRFSWTDTPSLTLGLAVGADPLHEAENLLKAIVAL